MAKNKGPKKTRRTKRADATLDFLRDRIGDGTAHNGQSKVDRYNWRTDVGPKPEFRWVNKADLAVDRQYQRVTNPHKVKAIAADFFWPAFGAAITCERPDGTLVVGDAQHRIFGALRRDDVSQIPCLIYKVGSIEEEAEIFLKVNTLRRALSALDKFNPLVVTRDVAALVVKDLVEGSDRELAMNGTRAVRCVGKMMRLANQDADRLRRIWPLLLALTPDTAITDVLIGGIFYLEGAASESLTVPRWRSRLIAVGCKRLTDGAKAAAAFFSKGGDKVYARGMLEQINKGLQKRLEMKGEAA